MLLLRGISSSVERELPKLERRVRFPYPASERPANAGFSLFVGAIWGQFCSADASEPRHAAPAACRADGADRAFWPRCCRPGETQRTGGDGRGLVRWSPKRQHAPPRRLRRVARLPDAARAYVEPASCATTRLTRDQRPGGTRPASFGSALGFERDDWPTLADALVAGAPSAEVTGRRDRRPAARSTRVLIAVAGVNGRTATVVTGWQVGPSGARRLVTAYVRG